jgi:hypothetical protein
LIRRERRGNAALGISDVGAGIDESRFVATTFVEVVFGSVLGRGLDGRTVASRAEIYERFDRNA